MPNPRRRPSFQSAQRTLVPLVLGIGLSLSAQAQSLLELFDAAHAYDATYLSARSQAESAPFRAAQSDALRLPSAAMTAGASTTQLNATSGAGLASDSQQVAVQAKQTLFNRSNDATIKQAARLLDVAKADLETAEQDLIIRVALAYFDVLAAQDALATTRANVTAITEQLASAKRNFEVGTATITDTREAQAKYDLGRAQEIAAANDLLTKSLFLDQLVGRSGVKPKALLVPVVLPGVVPADAEEWVTSGDATHPQIRKARLGLEVAQLESDKSRAGHMPTIDAVASIGESHSTGSAITASGSRPGTSRTSSIGLQLNWPIFTGFAVENRTKETIALEDKARNDVDVARRAIAQAARSAFFGVRSGIAQVGALEAAESSSKLALEATQLGYKVGVRVNLDVLNAQTQLFQTQRDLARARYDVIVGGLKLRQASGQLNAQDVAAVNRLLAP
jgi:outer membrane protein